MSASPSKPMPSLPAQEAENLRRVCVELKLPADALEQLEFAALNIRFMETVSVWKSAPVRRRELVHVAELAKTLNDALQGLDYTDRATLHIGFKGASIRMQLDTPDPIRQVFLGAGTDHSHGAGRRDVACENVLLLGDVLLTLEELAGIAAQHVKGQETGRQPRSEQLVSYIDAVAWCAHLNGITIGRGGRFHRLCEAVFLAGGVSTDPEAAIRKFVAEYLPTYLEMWQAVQSGDEDAG